MKRLLYGLAFVLVPTIAYAISQFTPAAVNGTLHLTTPATLADKQSSTFLSDAAGNLNVNLAASAVPISVVTTVPLYAPVGAAPCKLTVTGGTAIATTSCTGGVPATANYALVCNEGSVVRYSQTSTPTTSIGQLLGTGATSSAACTTFGPSANSALTNLRWIEQTGSGTGILDITFFLYQ